MRDGRLGTAGPQGQGRAARTPRCAPFVAPAKSPVEPADYRSTHFLIHTDLPAVEARDLLERMETMLTLVSKYFGEAPRGTIECYVVRDLNVWPEGSLEAVGRAKIASGAGVTHVETRYRNGKAIDARAVVYAVADHGTPQHEAVHAYCGQTFGRVGPLWYSEGMAEMGQYWRKEDNRVHCHPFVLDYLKKHEPRSVREIVGDDGAAPGAPAGPGERTGDSWQAYASRWALCHLLANNTNYRERFRPLGLAYLNGAPASFSKTYGAMLDEIDFEYRLFVANLEQGYAVDLCSWNWSKKFREPTGSAIMRTQILAKAGWQPTGVLVKSENEYEYTASGTWQLEPAAKPVSADGAAGGTGQLEAVVLHGFELSKPFSLASHGAFKPPVDGKLFLRCREKWGQLADNSGSVNFKLKNAGQGNPLPKPEMAQEPRPVPPDRNAEHAERFTRARRSGLPRRPVTSRKADVYNRRPTAHR